MLFFHKSISAALYYSPPPHLLVKLSELVTHLLPRLCSCQATFHEVLGVAAQSVPGAWLSASLKTAPNPKWSSRCGTLFGLEWVEHHFFYLNCKGELMRQSLGDVSPHRHHNIPGLYHANHPTKRLQEVVSTQTPKHCPCSTRTLFLPFWPFVLLNPPQVSFSENGSLGVPL